MKLTVSNRHAIPSESANEAMDIDVTPIMNMFVVLIPFLVSMAVFTHLAVHKFYLPPEASAGLDQNGPVKFKTTLVLTGEAALVTLGGDQIDSLPVENGEYPFEKLKPSLEKAMALSGEPTKSVVSVRDSVEFKYVVNAMDICRESGFAEVGLTSAPEKEVP